MYYDKYIVGYKINENNQFIFKWKWSNELNGNSQTKRNDCDVLSVLMFKKKLNQINIYVHV